MAIERAQAGFQMGFHAIGDRAVGMALDAFAVSLDARRKMRESLLPQIEKNTHAHITFTDAPRYRIEHSQVVDAGDFGRYSSSASSPPCSPTICSLT